MLAERLQLETVRCMSAVTILIARRARGKGPFPGLFSSEQRYGLISDRLIPVMWIIRSS
jgi:hypothetical protein